MQLATAQVGLILVNINPAYRTAELEYALNKVGCKALVSMRAFKTSDYLGMLRELAPELGLCLPGKLAAKHLPRCARWCGLMSLAKVKKNPACGVFPNCWHAEPQDERIDTLAATLKNTDPINIQFTSGTTSCQGRRTDPPQHSEQRVFHW